MAELHSMAIADWSRSIHLTHDGPIRMPLCNFGSEREKAVSLQMSAFPQYGNQSAGSQSAERKVANNREESETFTGSWCLIAGASEFLL